MHYAMKRIGRIAAKILNVETGIPKLYRSIKWEYGFFNFVLVDNPKNNNRYVVTVIF